MLGVIGHLFRAGRRPRYGITLCLLSLVAAAQAAAAGEQAGTVLTLRGSCLATTEGAPRTLIAGAPIFVGDVLESAPDARLKLQLIDGSVISMASASTLTITDFAAGSNGEHRTVDLKLGNGLLRAVVSTMAPPSHFEVDTATGVAAVRGTDWFVRTDPTMTQVGVLTGKVRLSSSATHHAVDIPAHWGARLEAGKDPVPPRRWKNAEFDDVISRTDVN